MRVIETYMTLSCVPAKINGGEVYCDKVDNCDTCLKVAMATVERESEDIQNFKVEKINITKILDLKKRDEDA